MFLSDKFIGQNLPGSKAFRVKRSKEVGVFLSKIKIVQVWSQGLWQTFKGLG